MTPYASSPARRAPAFARLRAREAWYAGIVVFLSAWFAVSSARAQEPSPGAMAAAKELIEVKGAMQMFDPLVPGVIETAKNAFLPSNPGLAKDLNEVAAQLRNEFAAKRGEVIEQMARVYAQHLSEAELREVLAFYRTPVGKKFIAEEVLIVEQSMRAIQAWAERFSDEMLGRLRAEMLKRGHKL